MGTTSNRWWLWTIVPPVALTALLLLQVPMAAIQSASGLPDLAQTLLLLPFAALGLVALLLLVCSAPGMLVGFHADATHLKERNATWTPNPWVWTALFFVVTPLVAGPLYVWERHRHVGVDWSVTPILGRMRVS